MTIQQQVHVPATVSSSKKRKSYDEEEQENMTYNQEESMALDTPSQSNHTTQVAADQTTTKVTFKLPCFINNCCVIKIKRMTNKIDHKSRDKIIVYHRLKYNHLQTFAIYQGTFFFLLFILNSNTNYPLKKKKKFYGMLLLRLRAKLSDGLKSVFIKSGQSLFVACLKKIVCIIV